MFTIIRMTDVVAQANSEDNNWGNYNQFMPGGYLEDLWIYTKELDFTTSLINNYRTSNGETR